MLDRWLMPRFALDRNALHKGERRLGKYRKSGELHIRRLADRPFHPHSNPPPSRGRGLITWGLRTRNSPLPEGRAFSKLLCTLAPIHPELVEGCPFKPPMVRQAHHEVAGSDFEKALSRREKGLAISYRTLTYLVARPLAASVAVPLTR